jgi:glycosyltransferase involved in cell wall biosynthesis
MPFSIKNLINGFVADAPRHVGYLNKYYLRLLFTSFFSRYVISNSRAGLVSYRVPRQKGVCIYNGVDLERFNNLPDPSVHLDTYFKGEKADRFIVMMVASFSIFKDYATLIKVADVLCREDRRYVFMLVGKGDKLEKIRSSVPSEWLDRNIILTGMVDHVESLLQIAQVGVLLTNTKIIGEGVSNSIIEYMAMGKPVIATRCAGNAETVIEGKNGFLVNDGDVNAIATHIRDLKSNKDLREELGRNGRKTVQEKFDLVKNVKHYCDLYEKMMRD